MVVPLAALTLWMTDRPFLAIHVHTHTDSVISFLYCRHMSEVVSRALRIMLEVFILKLNYYHTRRFIGEELILAIGNFQKISQY